MHATPVLVTGATGFIGSHLVERLVRDGARVRGFAHYNARGDRGNLELIDPEALEEVDVVFGDLRNPWSVREAATGQEVIFHLGALISIPYSYRAPADFVETNVVGTLNVLQAARDAGSRRVVHTSTSEVYGTAQAVPIAEDHRLHAQSPYAASKVGADQLAQSFHLAFELPVVTVRPFNTYGPRQSERALVPTVATQALFASEIRIGSLEPTRDLTYVEDTVDAFVRLAAAHSAPGLTVNVGTGREVSVRDLVGLVLDVVGRELPVRQDPDRIRPDRSEVEQLVCDASLAGELVGWEAETDLREGLVRTVEWIRAHAERYRPGVYTV